MASLPDNPEEQGWEITDPLHRKLYESAKPFLSTRSNAIHSRISYHFALQLLEEEGGDPKVVIPAILLHDVGWSRISEQDQHLAFGPNIQKPEVQRFHEVEGAKLARAILRSFRYSETRIVQIEEIINGHDTRDRALNLNDKIVKDADKLWRFSYEGFVVDFKRFNLRPQEWFEYLSQKIATWFHTPTARRIANEEIKKRRMDVKKWTGAGTC